MNVKNKYYRRSKISQKRFENVLNYFVEDKTASQVEKLTRISVRSVNPMYLKIRQRIAQYNESTWQELTQNKKKFVNVSRTAIERPCSIKGHKILVLILSEFDDYVYLEVAKDARKTRKNQRNHLRPEHFLSGINTDQQNNVFWPFLIERLSKFRGLAEQTFYLHMKETEFRFNYSGLLMPKLKEILESNPL